MHSKNCDLLKGGELKGEELMCILRSANFVTISIIVLSAVVMMAAPCKAGIDPESVAAMWLLDGLDGNFAEDLSGNEHDGTAGGAPKDVAGKFGEALEFTNSDEITVADNEKLNFGEDSFTVVLWLNFSIAQDWNRLVRERNPSAWGSGNYGWEIQTQGAQIHFSVDDAAGGHQKTTYPGIGDGEWHHGAMIIDREEEILRTYIDGDNEMTVPIGNIGSVTEILPVVIGGGFIGELDEIAIFYGVLDLEDVQAIMNTGLVEAVGGAAVSPAGKLPVTWAAIRQF